MSPHKILDTEDGSATIFSEQFQATYHSTKGAVTESKVVFIDTGLKYRFQQQQTPVKIFEMGLGTGLNTYLSYQFSESTQANIYYHAIEAYPLDPAAWNSLKYTSDEAEMAVFRRIHEEPWHEKTELSSLFTFFKTLSKIEDFSTDETFDIIFFDAFAPSTQPDLWGDSIVNKMSAMLVKGGILVTYCAQGEFKRCLRRHGFSVESLPGPPGKREITRATKL